MIDGNRNGRFDAGGNDDSIIQTIPEFKGVGVSVVAGSSVVEILRFDRWGQAGGQGSMRMLFVPVASGVASPATTTL